MTTDAQTKPAIGAYLAPACDRCHSPVRDVKDGVLAINSGKAGREVAENSRREWMVSGELLRLDEIELRAPVHWKWTHDGCYDDHDNYYIDGNRIDSLAKAFDWTFHLGEKVWFDVNVWGSAIRKLYNIPFGS